MSLQENKALVLHFVEEVENQHNLAAIDELFSHDFVDHSALTGPPGIEGVKKFFSMMFATFPDMHFTINQQLAEGDQVATHKTFHGTHHGEFMGIPATGKQISIEAMDIYTIHEGKITDHWAVGDWLGMLHQLGVESLPA